jgi:ABC-type uncharacterized transport system fused permease/ATPase subunit
LGHANRAAKLLHNAAAIARKSGDSDALTLKRNPKNSRRRSSSRRESAGVKTCVAEFTEVTVKNPFNVTLIKDLSMQVQLYLRCAPHCAVAPRRSIIRHNCSTLPPPPPQSRHRTPHLIPLQILPGQGCLISGPSGCGKSSLLRVMGKLWTAAAGSIRIPQHVGPEGVFFLPQRALSPIASVISILIV